MHIDSYIEPVTIVNLCECMDIESHINFKKEMVEDAMAEEEGSKMIYPVQRKMGTMMDRTLSLPTSHRPLHFLCYESNIAIVFSSLRLAEREIELERSVRLGGKRANFC